MPLTSIALLLVLRTLQVAFANCVFPTEDAVPKGLEERALDSEVVIAGYTRAVFKNSSSTRYSAEFIVFNIIKGEDRVVEVYKERKPSSLETALNRRLVNVSNFGDPSKCESDVSPGETYILLLDVLDNGGLSARYDGAYGSAVVFSRDKEMALEAIGSSPWGEWSPCSGSCGGGIQQRKRECNGDSKCSNEDGQQRTCNMFSCHGVLNILEAAGVHKSALRPTSRPTAYKLLPSGSWRSGKEEIVFPRTFPWEFSLLVTVRVKPSSTSGFLLRVLHSDSLQVGLYISDTLTLVLSDKNNIRVSFVKSLFDHHWHQLAFSVKRDTVSFYMNCEYSGKLPIPGKIRPFGFQPATVIVGSTGEHELDAFQGDIEQIIITGSPDSAEKQCNSSTQPLSSRPRAYSLAQEVRPKPVFTPGTLNDQLPLRGDIIDDEDFSFEERGSGDSSGTADDDYDDYKTDKKESGNGTKRENKIPLKAENTDDNEDDEEEEDDNEDDESKLDDAREYSKKEDENDEKEVDDDEKDDEYDEKEDEDEDEEDEGDAKHDVNDKKEEDDVLKKNGMDNEALDNEDKSDNINSEENEIIEGKKHREEKEKILTSTTVSKNFDYDNERDFTVTKSTLMTTASPMELSTKVKFDYDHPDEEPDKDEEDFEGSGSIPKIELAWSEWSPCSSSCNWGRRTRTSYCLDNGLNLETCTLASSKRSETEACFLTLCPTTTTAAPSTTTTVATTTTTQPFAFNISGGNIPKLTRCWVRCLNGGTCRPPYECICPPGVYGSLCQYVKETCRVHCKNGGTCHSGSSCSCPKGFYGSECQYALCKPHCMNGGTCVASNKCRCKPGYVGNSCQKAICHHGCKNGGECVAPNKCVCRSGFTGKDCSLPHCDPPCQNGGECVKPYFCHCPLGTKGNYCEKFHCNCQNGGTCIGKGKCSCPRGYAGYKCEQAYCPGGCFNGGICGKTGKCVCPSKFSGLRCETKKSCNYVEIKEPYKRGYKQKVTTQAKVPCGAWGWKMCTKTKVHYEIVYKTFYKTSYECEGTHKTYSHYQKLKSV